MENSVLKPEPGPVAKLKDIRKEITEKLHSALSDHKILLGEEKWVKHIKKMSKGLAEDIVKAAQKIAKKKAAKVKKKAKK
jgi:hypothetical protein